MKNIIKLVGIIALVAVIGFGVAACKNSTTPTPPPSDDTFTTLAALATWLAAQPANSATSPYTVKLTSVAVDFTELRTTLNDAGKYVNLDLSGSTITTIPNSAFMGDDEPYGCAYLTGITIPDSVTNIGQQAFPYCTSLTSVTIPNTVTSIGLQAFYGCASLTSVTIPNSVTTIEMQTFTDCTSLTSVTIPNSVTSIEQHAFFNCTSLTSVTFQGTIIEANFRDGAFQGDLKSKYLAGGGGIGTYKTTSPVNNSSVWTKQP